jgi:radical SAM protein with 4Fe4S-binding SPASM domain
MSSQANLSARRNKPRPSHLSVGRPADAAFRVRGGRCALWSQIAPFRAAYWPDIEALAKELGMAWPQDGEEAQRDFVAALAERVGFVSRQTQSAAQVNQIRGDILRREDFRRGNALLVFVGCCSRQVVLGAVEILANRLQRRPRITIEFRQWDALTDWAEGGELLSDTCNYLYVTRRCRGQLTVFSKLLKVPSDLWQFAYDRPSIRVGWFAQDLLDCGSAEEFERCRASSIAMKNMERLGEAGLWQHVVLPVSRNNVGILGEIVHGLLELTRGASVECVPVPLVPAGLFAEEVGEGARAEAPEVDAYVAALLGIYRDKNIPLDLVSPLSWVSARVRAEEPLVNSAASAGAELAVLPNGDIYAGGTGIGLERWRIGNVYEEESKLRWERLDVIPEMQSTACAPERCRSCDWLNRCGGADASVCLRNDPASMHPDEALEGGDSPRGSSAFELYCGARQALFEEMLWDMCESAAQGSRATPRERLELEPTAVRFVPVQEAARAEREVAVAGQRSSDSATHDSERGSVLVPAEADQDCQPAKIP